MPERLRPPVEVRRPNRLIRGTNAAVTQAQERVDDALNVLTRLEAGDTRFDDALQEFEDAQAARKSAEREWWRKRR